MTTFLILSGVVNFGHLQRAISQSLIDETTETRMLFRMVVLLLWLFSHTSLADDYNIKPQLDAIVETVSSLSATLDEQRTSISNIEVCLKNVSLKHVCDIIKWMLTNIHLIL